MAPSADHMFLSSVVIMPTLIAAPLPAYVAATVSAPVRPPFLLAVSAPASATLPLSSVTTSSVSVPAFPLVVDILLRSLFLPRLSLSVEPTMMKYSSSCILLY